MFPSQRVLTHDPTVTTDVHRPDTRFIPLQVSDLAAAIATEPSRFNGEGARLREVLEAIREVVAQEALAFERDLSERYMLFNPDRDTLALGDTHRTRDAYAEVTARLEYLLRKANFERMSLVQLQGVVREAHSAGLRVRLCDDRLEQLSIWTRGLSQTQRVRRNWRRPWRSQKVSLSVYPRIVLVFRLCDDPNVQIKLFKDIPFEDVEALLPHAETEMSWLDRLKVIGGGAGMVGSTTTKAFAMLTGLAYWSKLLWVILIGGAVLLFRAITGYRSARTQRDWQRTQHLYYQNLDNNAGAIHALVSMTAQEEVKEAGLTYCFVHEANGGITDANDLRKRVEAYLDERFGIEVRFDVLDALQTVDRLGLWNDAERFCVAPPDEALQRLRVHWEGRRSAQHHNRMAAPPPVDVAGEY